MRFTRPTSIVAVLSLGLGLLALSPATASSKDTARITVTVTLDGKPVKDMYVQVVSKDHNYAANWTKGKKYSTKVRPGTYNIKALNYTDDLDVYTGYPKKALRKQDSAPIKVAKGEHRKVTIKLVRAATVTGRVVDATGAPVPDVFIRATNSDREGRYSGVFTDSEGWYRTSGLAGGAVTVTTGTDRRYAGEFDNFGSVTVSAKKGRTVTAPDLVLNSEPRGTLTVRLDAPFHPRLEVEAYNADRTQFADLVHDPATGLWSQTVSAGTWTVEAPGTGIASRPATVAQGTTIHAGTLRVPDASGTLHLTVLTSKGVRDRRAPITIVTAAGDELSVSRVRRDGSVVVPNLVPGTYRVFSDQLIYARGKGAGPFKVKVEADVVTKVTYRQPKTRTIEGRVLHKGRPVPGIQLLPSTGWQTGRTDSKGRFRITGVTRGKVDLTLVDRSPLYPIQTMTVSVKKRNAKGVVFSITR